MNQEQNPEGTSGDERFPDADDADFRVEIRDRPALVRPDIEVELGVALRGVDISVVRDGVLDFRSGPPYRPSDFLHRRVRDAVENEGYSIERYADVGFTVPTEGSHLTSVKFTLKVTGADPNGADD